MITIQETDFDAQAENQKLIIPSQTGALVNFVGLVREFNHTSHRDETNKNNTFFLEHYPGMTERVLRDIEASAHNQWDLQNTSIIHRVGYLKPSDQIVYIGVTSAHRKHAFAACEYMIDLLKTQAPFWKKEGNTWVEAKESDTAAANNWLNKATT